MDVAPAQVRPKEEGAALGTQWTPAWAGDWHTGAKPKGAAKGRVDCGSGTGLPAWAGKGATGKG